MAAHKKQECSGLRSWRAASRVMHGEADNAAGYFQSYIAKGGPEMIAVLKSSVARLEGQLVQLEKEKQIQRYRALQTDLKERDQVVACLRKLLLAGNKQWTEKELNDEVNLQLKLVVKDKKQSAEANVAVPTFQDTRLFGASRELLLQENSYLRSLVEQRLITHRTWNTHDTHSTGSLGTSDQGSPVKKAWKSPSKSQLATAAMKAGPCMEVIKALQVAAHQLQAAEQQYQPPMVANAEVQVDDGSAQLVGMLREQVSVLAGQKAQLLHKLADMEAAASILAKQFEEAKEQAALGRRQVTDVMLHQDHLSKDVRAHLASEQQRADAAEADAQQLRLQLLQVADKEQQLLQQCSAAQAEAKVLQKEMADRNKQLASLHAIHQQLATSLDHVTGAHTDARDQLAATVQAVQQQVVKGLQAVQQSTDSSATQVAQVVAAEQQLAAEVRAAREITAVTLAQLSNELSSAQRGQHQAQRQLVAAQILGRMEDQKFTNAVSKLRADMPGMLAQQIAAQLSQTTSQQPQAADVPEGQQCPPPVFDPSDLVSDATTQVIASSQQLRAQLNSLLGISSAAASNVTASQQTTPMQQPQAESSPTSMAGGSCWCCDSPRLVPHDPATGTHGNMKQSPTIRAASKGGSSSPMTVQSPSSCTTRLQPAAGQLSNSSADGSSAGIALASPTWISRGMVKMPEVPLTSMQALGKRPLFKDSTAPHKDQDGDKLSMQGRAGDMLLGSGINAADAGAGLLPPAAGAVNLQNVTAGMGLATGPLATAVADSGSVERPGPWDKGLRAQMLKLGVGQPS